MRAFVAITLPDPAREVLASACEAFRAAAPETAGEKWVPAENLHVTLEFIGDLSEEAVPSVLDALSAACEPVAPFMLSLGDIVPKPGGRHARMLWARFADGVEPAQRLESAIREGLADAVGLETDGRPYTPHVTLARFRRQGRVPARALDAANALLDAASPSCGVAAGPPATFVSVRHVTLMSSLLSRGAPVYSEVARIPL